MTEQSLKRLIKEMSLTEKINQLHQVVGGFYSDETVVTGPLQENGFTEESTWLAEAGADYFPQAVYHSGCPMLCADIKLQGFNEAVTTAVSDAEQAQLQKAALEAAASAGVVVLALGEHYLQSGEATSNANIQLPHVQLELFERVCDINPHVIVVLFSAGRMISGSWRNGPRPSRPCGCRGPRGQKQL